VTPSAEDAARIRALNEAITRLEPPALSRETFARITARRARGERIALPISSISQSLWVRKPVLLATTLVGLAAAALLASLVHDHPGDMRASAAPELMALSPVDAACATYTPQDSSMLRHLMVSAFGVAAACGAELEPAVPLAVDPSQITPGRYTYGGRTITDGLHTREFKPTTISISRTIWHGTPALIAVRDGPLITRVSIDSITVSARDLTPLHWAAWYPTQHPVGSVHADFAGDSVTIVMKGRVDTSGTFAYMQTSARLPQEWAHYLTVPSLPLDSEWHGVLEIAAPFHPHTHAYFTTGWATMSLRVVGREWVTVPAGSFDCWKVSLGQPGLESYMWVSRATHLVVRSQTIYRFGDTEFDDRVDLQSVASAEKQPPM
jgi:hypothetical protein